MAVGAERPPVVVQENAAADGVALGPPIQDTVDKAGKVPSHFVRQGVVDWILQKMKKKI